MKKNKKPMRYNKWGIDANTTSRDWGFHPIPGKGGATTNFEIPEWMFERELKEMKEGAVDA